MGNRLARGERRQTDEGARHAPQQEGMAVKALVEISSPRASPTVGFGRPTDNRALLPVSKDTTGWHTGCHAWQKGQRGAPRPMDKLLIIFFFR
jgi:hypothetical protein